MTQHCKNILIKLSILVILFIVIGLPINNLFGFVLILLFLQIIIFSKIHKNFHLPYFPLCLLFLFFLYKMIFPTLNIQEGHNVVIINNNSSDFYEKVLPKEIYIFFKNEFIKHYNDSECDKNIGNCWKNFNPLINKKESVSTNTLFAFSSDWSVYKTKYSNSKTTLY